MSDEEFYEQPTLPTLIPENSHIAKQSIPKTIGPYRIVSLLEKGGMSLLYLGTHPETKEPVTVKVLIPKYADRQDILNRFLNEAEILSMTDHPNIVRLLGHGKWEGGLYIAMEFVEGISLRQYLLKNPVSLSRALDIIIEIGYALCHLHTYGVIHRDLKPENILIAKTGEVKIIDFGIAEMLAKKAEEWTGEAPSLIGTPIYMSPEQQANASNVSYAADVYSLGIIAYELILGRLSHGQIHLSLMPKGIQKILHKALQPSPEKRYQDIVDLIADLSAYKHSEALEKEKKPGDPLSELWESLKLAQKTLVASSPPNWPSLEIGLAGHVGINMSGIYYDFFEISEDSYGIIMGESSSKGAEGVIYTAVLRGMVRALCRLTTKPVELISILNDILFRDSMEQAFALNYLILNPKENKLRYIACGYGDLWMLPSKSSNPIKIATDNPPLGSKPKVEFVESANDWNADDLLVLNTFASPKTKNSIEGIPEDVFEQALVQNLKLTPQKQVEGILFNIKVAAKDLLKERSVAVISILRSS